MPAAATAPDPYKALHGDTWRSPWWIVPNLAAWTVRAQVWESGASEPLFVWALVGGDFDAAQGVLSGKATLRLADDSEVEVPALRVIIDPKDWAGKPNRRLGTLEVEFSRGDLADPAARFTKLSRRFEIIADLIQ